MTTSPRLGIVRPDRPVRWLADAEGRVLDAELSRRLGPVSLDLRVDGPPVGRWGSLDHAAWPRDVAAVIDVGALYGEGVPPLTTLFGRTVEPAAAEVRRRMLIHLGIIPDTEYQLDDSTLAPLGAPSLTATDMWLLARSATRIAIDDPAIVALVSATSGPSQITLDHLFDRIAADVSPDIDAPATIAALTAECDDLRHDLDELQARLVYEQRQAADLGDDLRAQIEILRDRLDRAEIDRPR